MPGWDAELSSSNKVRSFGRAWRSCMRIAGPATTAPSTRLALGVYKHTPPRQGCCRAWHRCCRCAFSPPPVSYARSRRSSHARALALRRSALLLPLPSGGATPGEHWVPVSTREKRVKLCRLARGGLAASRLVARASKRALGRAATGFPGPVALPLSLAATPHWPLRVSTMRIDGDHVSHHSESIHLPQK